jgi:hypothetical protein
MLRVNYYIEPAAKEYNKYCTPPVPSWQVVGYFDFYKIYTACTMLIQLSFLEHMLLFV